MPDWIIVIIATSIGTVIGFILSVVHGKQKENERRRKESLRNHFKRFQESIIEPIMNALKGVSNDAGTLEFGGDSGQYLKSMVYGESNSDYEIFGIHFPTQAKEIEDICGSYEAHNRNIEDFKKELAKCIEDETRGLRLQKDDGKPPFIYLHTTEALYYTLYQLVEAKLAQDSRRAIVHDFSGAEIEKINNRWRLKHKHPLQCIHIYAELESENQARFCQQCLIMLQDSSSLQEQTSELYLEAIQLETRAKVIAGRLDFICEQYGNLNNFIKKLKKCPYCRVIV